MRARTLTLLPALLLAAGLAGCTTYDDGYYGGYGYGYDSGYGAGVTYGYPGPYYGFGAYPYSYGYPYILRRERHFDGHRHRHFRPHRAERHDRDGRARFDDDGRRDRAAPRRDRDDARDRDSERHRRRGADRDALRSSARTDHPDAGPPPIRVERRAPERREGHADREEGRRAPARQRAEPPDPGADTAWSERRTGRFDGWRFSPSRPRGDRIWQSDK